MTEAALYLSTSPFETRVAAREEGRLVSYRAEHHRAGSVVGNLYRGKVTRVLSGMQAAFIDIGLPRDGFLYVREAGGVHDQFADVFQGEQPDPAGASGELAIGDLLREGQTVLVQVVKDPLGSKGARLTTYVTLPGRFLVYLPTVRQLGVSRRITDPDERARLKALIETFDDGGGWIVRTAGEGQGTAELEQDRRYLERLWGGIQGAAGRARPPAVVHRELSPVLRTVRDTFTGRYRECWVDDETAHREILDFLEQSEPALAPRVQLFEGGGDLMAAFGIDQELEKATRPKVWLRSGGYLVVNQTEALVAIDVNTGKYVGSTSLEDTVYRINLEAVREVVRQLRLRDLGGIVVIDFIDMERPEHRQQVYEALSAELATDPARTLLLPMSDIGLVQLTRKRTRPSLERSLTRECPHCAGTGRIKSLSTICLELRRRVLVAAEKGDRRPVGIAVAVHPEVARHLRGAFRELLEELEESHGVRVELREDPALRQEEFEVGG